MIMIFNSVLTPLDVLQHIEELQQNNMDDHAAWEMYYDLVKDSTPEMVRKAEMYKQKNDIWPSNIEYESSDVDIFMEHFII